ncbi:hypothetical protein BGZ51_002299 [Haplosporangium sp. Z 767]|nr:hypothetical protein BGZ51_002299 [Haplosporangium sp. Z 767]
MSFEPMQQQQQDVTSPKQQQQQKRNRLITASGSTTPLTPHSTDMVSWPMVGINGFGHTAMYMNPQQFHQQQIGSSTTIQSMTPDQFMGNDFDWVSGMNDLTPGSKANHSHNPTESRLTPPMSSSISSSSSASTSSTSTTVLNSSGDGNNSSVDIYHALVTAASNAPVSAASVVTPMVASPPLSFPLGIDISSPGLPSGAIDQTNAGSSPTSKAVRRWRSRGTKEPSPAASSATTESMAVTHFSPIQTPAMLTPLSPMTPYADGPRFMHQHQPQYQPQRQPSPLQKSNVLDVSAEDGAQSLATPPSTSSVVSNRSSTSLFDMLSSSPSDKPDHISMFGQHQRILSTASQESRNGGLSMSSSPIPKAVAHLRCSSNSINGHQGLSSSLASQSSSSSTTGQDGSSPDVEPILKLERRASITNSNSSGAFQTSPDMDAVADVDIDEDADGEIVEPPFDMDAEASSDVDLHMDSKRSSVVTGMVGAEGVAALEEDDSDPENNRPATCPHCHKEFQSKGLLRSHIVSHSSDRPFVCWECTDKSYKRNHDLLRHRREKHNIDGNVVPSRGSSRNNNANREGGTSSSTDRKTSRNMLQQQQHPQHTHHAPTVASQSPITGALHRQPHELMYSSHGLVYMNNGAGLSDLSPASGSPLDHPYSGNSVEYHQPQSHHHHLHQHSQQQQHSMYGSVGLGLGLDLGTGLSAATANAGGASGRGHRSSHASTSVGTPSAPESVAAVVGGRKRKLSGPGPIVPTLISPMANMMSVMPPGSTSSALSTSNSVAAISATIATTAAVIVSAAGVCPTVAPNLSLHQHPFHQQQHHAFPHHMASHQNTLSSPFMDGMGHFVSGGTTRSSGSGSAGDK